MPDLNMKERSWLAEHALLDFEQVLRYGMDYAAVADNIFEKGYADEFRSRLESLVFEEWGAICDICIPQAKNQWECDRFQIMTDELNRKFENARTIKYHRIKTLKEHK